MEKIKRTKKWEDGGVVYKYDWSPAHRTLDGVMVPYGRWSNLIYVGRVPYREDPGIAYSEEVFRSLYERRMLMGEAYRDARHLFLSTLID